MASSGNLLLPQLRASVKQRTCALHAFGPRWDTNHTQTYIIYFGETASGIGPVCGRFAPKLGLRRPADSSGWRGQVNNDVFVRRQKITFVTESRR